VHANERTSMENINYCGGASLLQFLEGLSFGNQRTIEFIDLIHNVIPRVKLPRTGAS